MGLSDFRAIMHEMKNFNSYAFLAAAPVLTSAASLLVSAQATCPSQSICDTLSRPNKTF